MFRVCVSSCRAKTSVFWERLPSQRVLVDSCSPLAIGHSRAVPAVSASHLRSSPITCRARQLPAGPASHLGWPGRFRNLGHLRFSPVRPEQSPVQTPRHSPVLGFLSDTVPPPARPEHGQTGHLGSLFTYLNPGRHSLLLLNALGYTPAAQPYHIHQLLFNHQMPDTFPLAIATLPTLPPIGLPIEHEVTCYTDIPLRVHTDVRICWYADM